MPFENFREVYPSVQAGEYDAIVTPRYVWTTISVRTASGRRQKVWMGDAWRRQVTENNLVWIYESDDDLWSESSIQRMMHFYDHDKKSIQKMWLERYTRYRQDRIRLSKFADGFTVATEPLGGIVRNYTDAPVHVIPNAIDMPSWEALMDGKQRTIPPLTIGWSGGVRDEADHLILAEAWKIVAQQCPEVKFIVFGHQSEVLLKSLPKNRIITIPWCEMEDYPGQLLNFDIGCCALEPIAWNETKSPNKWYEQSMAGVASIVSPTVYGRVVTDGVDALIATSVKDWVTAIVRLVNDPELRSRLVTRAQAKILSEHTTDQTVYRWIQAWEEIIEHARSKRMDREISLDQARMATT